METLRKEHKSNLLKLEELFNTIKEDVRRKTITSELTPSESLILDKVKDNTDGKFMLVGDTDIEILKVKGILEAYPEKPIHISKLITINGVERSIIITTLDYETKDLSIRMSAPHTYSDGTRIDLDRYSLDSRNSRNVAHLADYSDAKESFNQNSNDSGDVSPLEPNIPSSDNKGKGKEI
jgi:hypothetical protein